MILVGVEYGDAAGVPLRQRRRAVASDETPAMSLVSVLLDGMIGLVSEPVRCTIAFLAFTPLTAHAVQ